MTSGWVALRRFRSDQRGASIVLFAVVLLAIVGFAAIAVDAGFLYIIRNRLQATADAASLAAVRQLPDDTAVRAAASEYAGKNMPADDHGTVVTDSDIEIGNWKPDTRTFTAGGNPTNAVRVVVRRSEANGNAVETFFARILGIAEVDVEASAVSAFGSGDDPWDIVIVQDVTGSFSDELDDARAADQALLDCLKDSTHPDSLVGLVVFTGVGTVLEPLQPIGTGYEDMSDAIASIDECDDDPMPECSGTHVGAGIDTALDMFIDTPPTPGAERAMVIVGDGAPNASGPNSGYSDSELKNMARDLADDAAAEGISVFTVFYDEDDDEDAADFFESLVRGDGIALRTPDPADLPDLLFQICASGPVRLVR